MKYVRDENLDPIGVGVDQDVVTLTTQYLFTPERAFFLDPADARTLARRLKKAARKAEQNLTKEQ